MEKLPEVIIRTETGERIQTLRTVVVPRVGENVCACLRLPIADQDVPIWVVTDVLWHWETAVGWVVVIVTVRKVWPGVPVPGGEGGGT